MRRFGTFMVIFEQTANHNRKAGSEIKSQLCVIRHMHTQSAIATLDVVSIQVSLAHRKLSSSWVIRGYKSDNYILGLEYNSSPCTRIYTFLIIPVCCTKDPYIKRKTYPLYYGIALCMPSRPKKHDDGPASHHRLGYYLSMSTRPIIPSFIYYHVLTSCDRRSFGVTV